MSNNSGALLNKRAPLIYENQRKEGNTMQNDCINQVIKFLEKDLMPTISLEERGYANLEEANDLIFSDPLAFVLGLIFDQSIKSSIAWEGPFFLKKRLGHLDVHTIASMDNMALKNIIATKKALHRYPGAVANNVISTCKTLTELFSGKAENLWTNQPNFIDAKKNLLSLKGIGEKKANLAILMLVRDFNVPLEGIRDLPLAVDVHLKRVFIRSGLLESGNINELKNLQRNLKESYYFPALIGTAIWFIGRHHCSETSPLCDTCPITSHCMKKVHNE